MDDLSLQEEKLNKESKNAADVSFTAIEITEKQKIVKFWSWKK